MKASEARTLTKSFYGKNKKFIPLFNFIREEASKGMFGVLFYSEEEFSGGDLIFLESLGYHARFQINHVSKEEDHHSIYVRWK